MKILKTLLQKIADSYFYSLDMIISCLFPSELAKQYSKAWKHEDAYVMNANGVIMRIE